MTACTWSEPVGGIASTTFVRSPGSKCTWTSAARSSVRSKPMVVGAGDQVSDGEAAVQRDRGSAQVTVLVADRGHAEARRRAMIAGHRAGDRGSGNEVDVQALRPGLRIHFSAPGREAGRFGSYGHVPGRGKLDFGCAPLARHGRERSQSGLHRQRRVADWVPIVSHRQTQEGGTTVPPNRQCDRCRRPVGGEQRWSPYAHATARVVMPEPVRKTGSQQHHSDGDDSECLHVGFHRDPSWFVRGVYGQSAQKPTVQGTRAA